MYLAKHLIYFNGENDLYNIARSAVERQMGRMYRVCIYGTDRDSAVCVEGSCTDRELAGALVQGQTRELEN